MAAALALATKNLAAQGRRGKGGEKGGRESANMFEVTVHEFHEDLKLTAQQEPAWQVYEDRLRALAGDVARERRQPAAAVGLLQRIDRAVDVARDRLTAVEDIALAAKALYSKLTPQQQELADPRLANLITLPIVGGSIAEPAPRDRAK